MTRALLKWTCNFFSDESEFGIAKSSAKPIKFGKYFHGYFEWTLLCTVHYFCRFHLSFMHWCVGFLVKVILLSKVFFYKIQQITFIINVEFRCTCMVVLTSWRRYCSRIFNRSVFNLFKGGFTVYIGYTVYPVYPIYSISVFSTKSSLKGYRLTKLCITICFLVYQRVILTHNRRNIT
jgi:hypothetical protein